MPEQLIEILKFFWAVSGEMAPYLLFGFLMAGVLSVFVSPEFVERHLGGRGFWPIVKASAFGVPLPLCSCGVIPVATSIRRHGASRGATTAFLISTPQTGVDSIMMTFSLLGPVFAIYRPIAALISGAIGGAIVSATEGDGISASPAEKCNESCCATGAKSNALYRVFAYGFGTLPRDIARALLIGLIIAALISAFVPEGYFSQLVPPGPLQILLLMAVGVPIYICATASIPIAAGLILTGVSPGAVFALLMTGPATNAATVATIWKVMGRRTCLIYLGTMMGAAFVGGLVLDQILTPQQVQASMHHGWMPMWVKTGSAVALFAVLAVGAFFRPKGHHDHAQHAVSDKEILSLTIKGMTCSHCVDVVRKAMLEQVGVESVEIDLAAGKAIVSGDELDRSAICKVVEELGYSVAVDEKEA